MLNFSVTPVSFSKQFTNSWINYWHSQSLRALLWTSLRMGAHLETWRAVVSCSFPRWVKIWRLLGVFHNFFLPVKCFFFQTTLLNGKLLLSSPCGSCLLRFSLNLKSDTSSCVLYICRKATPPAPVLQWWNDSLDQHDTFFGFCELIALSGEGMFPFSFLFKAQCCIFCRQ